MTDQQFAAWLKNPTAIRCILVEVDVKLKVGGALTTRYLSDTGYVTSGSDTPANRIYSPVIAGGVKFTQTMALDGGISLAYGDIELNNFDGTLDTWLDDYWTGRTVKVFVGDTTWPRADFRQIFSGITTGIDSRRRDKINIKLSDKLQRLNSPMTEQKLGGASSLADQLIPLCFGECHNVEPLLTDQSIHEYQLHDGQIERIIEVRDNGVPVEFVPYLSLGKFRLVNNPVGQITASVQGDKPVSSTYQNNLSILIQRIVQRYGIEAQRFTTADFDTASLATFTAANVQPVGVYVKDRMNVLDVCNQLASSVGARLAMTPTGLMYLVKLHLPQGSSGTAVNNANMVDRSLEISEMPDVQAGVKIGYAKNWTVQPNLATGIVEEHRTLYADEWLTVTQTSTSAATNFNLHTEPDMQDTLLLTASDALTEASRRLGIWSVQRKVLKYKGYAELLGEVLGEPQTITHSRFGLSAGVTGQIVSISTDWINQKVEIEVLI